MNEDTLSQELTKLLTISNVDKNSSSEKIFYDMNQIPSFLTRRNKKFEQLLLELLADMQLEINKEHKDRLRTISIFMYKIIYLKIYQALWTTYLNAGIGNMTIDDNKSNEGLERMCRWPKEVKNMTKSIKSKHMSEDQQYLAIVMNVLHEIKYKLEEMITELNVKANAIHQYTLDVQAKVKVYIEKNMRSFRLHLEHQMEVIYYEYHIESLKIEFHRHYPCSSHKKLMREICCRAFNKKRSEEYYNYLKRLDEYYSSVENDFDNSSLKHILDSENDNNINNMNSFIDECKTMAVNSRLELFQLNLKVAEQEKASNMKAYEVQQQNMWQNRRKESTDHQLTINMIDLIQDRCKKINELFTYKKKPNPISTHMDINKMIKQQRKSHGDRKSQRLRRRYRRHQQIQNRNCNSQTMITTRFGSVNFDENHQRNLIRKARVDLNLSTMKSSISKSTNKNTTNLFIINYRCPKYLKQFSNVLIRSLKTNFNLSTINKRHRHFLLGRLRLFDQQYCLQMNFDLQYNYMHISEQEHCWPDEVYELVKTSDYDLCHQHIRKHIECLYEKLNQCELKLKKQMDESNMPSSLFSEMDDSLRDFVQYQRKNLMNRNSRLLSIYQKQLNNKQSQHIRVEEIIPHEHNTFVHDLKELRYRQVNVWKEMMMLETRISHNFLPEYCDYLEHFIQPFSYDQTMVDTKAFVYLRNQSVRIIKQAKRDWLSQTIHLYEQHIVRYEEKYQEKLKEMSEITSKQLFDETINHLRNYTKEIKRNAWNDIKSFRSVLLCRKQRSVISKTSIRVSVEPYLDLNVNPFNQQEWDYLCLGSSFIRLNQTAVRPRKQQEIAIKNEHESMFNKIQTHLSDRPHFIPKTNTIFKKYSTSLQEQLNEFYFKPIPIKDDILANQQKRIVYSIRTKIRQNNLVLRVADKSKIFYIGSEDDFGKKATNYFTQTNAYIELSENPFHHVMQRITQTLKDMATKKLILQRHLKKMLPDPNKSELSHLYFNPKTHKDGIPVRPIQNTIHAPTSGISKLLDRLIRPIFDQKCRSTTVIDGTDLIEYLEEYVNKGLLRSSTLFCTFDIHNLYTMLPQEEALDYLIEFLRSCGYSYVDNIGLDTIRQLASIVLKENVFVHDNKIFKQVIGGAMGSPFTLTLANIFMCKWQRELVRQQDITNEVYGRYIDDIFMTWNRSEQELRRMLSSANQWHPNIKIDFKIGKCLPFLDVLLENKNGKLKTSLYHKSNTEPYCTPFVSDHQKHVFGNIIQSALLRAVRYSSDIETFDRARRYIQLMLIYNRYPLLFVEKQFCRFFQKYFDRDSLLPYLINNHDFQNIRQLVKKQLRLVSNRRYGIDGLQPEYDVNKLIVHYSHERRFESMKRTIHKLHASIFNGTPAQDVRLIVGSRNRRDSRKELIRKRPPKCLLQNYHTSKWRRKQKRKEKIQGMNSKRRKNPIQTNPSTTLPTHS